MMTVILSMTLMFCTKEGPRGPRGPAGADGINGNDGTNGADGKDGNANVIVYMFTDSVKIKWSGSEINFHYDTSTPNGFNIPDSILNDGVVLVYHRVIDLGGNYQMWYPTPGLGYNALYQTRLYLNQFTLQIRAYKPDGSSWSGTLPQLTAIKVVLIPASTIYNMRKAGDVVNFDDYAETMKYLGATD